MRAIVLSACFAVGSGKVAWLGYAAAVISGLAPSGSLRSPGGVLAAAVLVCAGLAGLCALVRRVAGAGIEPPGRARAEGRAARNSLLPAAAFLAFAVVFAVFAFGQVSPLALSPAALVALVLAPDAARRSALLRLTAVCTGALYVVGLAASLARAF